MSFQELKSAAVDIIAAHLAECVTLDGHPIRGIPRIGTSVTAALTGVNVTSKDATVSITNADADRLGLRKGMDINVRERDWVVRDFSRGNNGWTLMELE